jgi:hypothetical protein
MIDLLSSCVMDSKFSAVDIPSIAEELCNMRNALSHASQAFTYIDKASISLEETIRNSNYVDMSVYHEVNALKQSARNLEHNLKISISEVREKFVSLEIALRRNTRIPANLSTADDISVAFNIAVNNRLGSINWPLAEVVLERYLTFQSDNFATVDNNVVDHDKSVWYTNNF